MDKQTYRITKEIRILHQMDDWEYFITSDEYGTVQVTCTEGLESMTGKTTTIHIPQDCISNFISALEQFQ